MTKNFWLNLGLLLSLGGLILGYFLYTLQPSDAGGEGRIIRIVEGQGFREISEYLKSQGLIRSARSFNLYSILVGKAEDLRQGIYWLSPASSTPEIIRELVRREPRIATITLTEGSTIKDIEKKLVSYGVLGTGGFGKVSINEFIEEFPFLKNSSFFEGYLFPDTYEFYMSSDPKVVLRKFLNNFKEKALPVLESLSLPNQQKKLILASILEREVPFENDRRIVAGILEKRLKLGMVLQVDATILYAKCDLGNDCEGSRRLSKSDFEKISSYNTYKNSGLPPAPISNPGLEAIVAALNPRVSPYFYYLSDPKNKKTIFAITLDEHNENRFKYLNIY